MDRDFLIGAPEEIDDENNNYNGIDDENENENKEKDKSESTTPKTKKKRKAKKDDLMTEDEKQEIQEKAKLAIAKTVADIIDFRVKQWNDKNVEVDDDDLKLKSTKEFVFGLTELIYDTVVVLGNDLEHFRKHRNRQTVMIDDFMLFCRRNKDMKQKMIQYHNKIQQQ